MTTTWDDCWVEFVAFVVCTNCVLNCVDGKIVDWVCCGGDNVGFVSYDTGFVLNCVHGEIVDSVCCGRDNVAFVFCGGYDVDSIRYG